MTYSYVGGMKIIEENGLKVEIDYNNVINKINEEIDNPRVYSTDEYEEGETYTFGVQNIEKKDYIKSLIEIKRLIDNIFTSTPTINIFDFVPLTKKNKFALNRKVHIASPIAGLFYNYYDYKYIRYFALCTKALDENTIEVYLSFEQSDTNKFAPIFFQDYTTPIIRVKKKSIKKTDLKPGYIYSDELQKKYFLYLGTGIFNFAILKKRGILDITAFPKTIEIKEEDYIYGSQKEPLPLFVKISKKEAEDIIKNKKTIDANKFLEEKAKKVDIFNTIYCVKSLKLYKEEYNFLENQANEYCIRDNEVNQFTRKTECHYLHVNLNK